MVLDLSVNLRQGTKKSHRLAESTPFIKRFFEGKLSVESYRMFLVQLLHIYTALEDQQDRYRDHTVIHKIRTPALYRRAAIIEDLDYFFGDADWHTISPFSTTQSYAARINTLSGQWIEGLIAHHYTRYLGDLSGGQALKRIVARTFGLSSDAGLAFYDFPKIADHGQFKDDYRATLDSLDFDPMTSEKIVAEANHAFELNRRVFDSMMDFVE